MDCHRSGTRGLDQADRLEQLGYKLRLATASGLPEHILQVKCHRCRTDLQARATVISTQAFQDEVRHDRFGRCKRKN
jgi:hypothetical protein